MLIIKVIGALILLILALIITVGLLMQTKTDCDGSERIMIVITYSDTEENIEQLLRNASQLCQRSKNDICIVAVYCGVRDTEKGESEQFEICKRFAIEHEYVKCVTYDRFLEIFSAGENVSVG